jgi:hypothetical protein
MAAGGNTTSMLVAVAITKIAQNILMLAQGSHDNLDITFDLRITLFCSLLLLRLPSASARIKGLKYDMRTGSFNDSNDMI